MNSLAVIERKKDSAYDIMPVLSWLRGLPGSSVHMWGTSPPYYGLRSYLEDGHPDKKFEIGAEDRPEEYVDKMVEVFSEARRVLHPSGVLMLNLGDTYANDPKGPNGTPGLSLCGSANQPMPAKNWRGSYNLKKKDLIGIPWRVAFALQDDGWYLRQWMPWVKRNAMSESVDDRPGSQCESIFLLTRSPSYYYDFVAVRREDRGQRQGNVVGFARPERKSMGGRGSSVNFEPGGGRAFRNNDLWFDSVGMLQNDDGDALGIDCGIANFPGQHFAVFPRALIEPLILCGSPERGVCPRCGNPWERIVERERVATRPGTNTKVTAVDQATADAKGWSSPNVIGNRDPERHCTIMKTLGWAATCGHGLKAVPAIVGDMFAGTGTTMMVARELGRNVIGCDLDPRNAAFIDERMAGVVPDIMSQFLGDELETV